MQLELAHNLKRAGIFCNEKVFLKINHSLPSLQKPATPNGTKEYGPTIGLHKGPPHTKIYKTRTHTQHTHKHVCLLTYTHGLISNIWTCDIHIRAIYTGKNQSIHEEKGAC